MQSAVFFYILSGIRFMLDNPDYLQELTIGHAEDIHTLLTKELPVDKGLRHRRVDIKETQYRPLDHEFQIREAMRDTCALIIIANGYCPMAFRMVDSIDYKKAMLIFYEQNNLYAFKQIFISQYEFAVREYF